MEAELERYNDVTAKIIGCAYTVANSLGHGFLEKCYENGMVHELRKAGLVVAQQVELKVWYDGVVVGDFAADLLVDNVILIELRAIDSLTKTHSAQCINYLAATKLPICLLINFGKRVEVKRLAGEALRGFAGEEF